MATNAIAAMLDELMGRDRNLAPTEKRNQTNWYDSDVCKHYLVAFCPHELFVNTRADLGPCDKLHDDALRKEYQDSSKYQKMGYEEDFLRFLQGLISDVEKRIRRGHQRLALNNAQGSLTSNLNSLKDDKIKMLTERISDLVQQAEELGCEGKVEEAQGIMKLCDQLEEERRQLENSKLQTQSNEPEKTMEVCTVCGALLVVGDVQQRIDEHLMGKQHAGYARIRAFVENEKQKKNQSDEEREARLKKEREEREKEREKEREERRKREKEREERREKEREKEKKRREEREKEREKEKEKEKEREKERHKRHRSRSRDRRHRSRSRSPRRHRSRSRSRDRHRSKSSRSHRSRSRDRDSRRRSRSRDRKSRERSNRDSRDKERSRDSDRKDDHGDRKDRDEAETVSQAEQEGQRDGDQSNPPDTMETAEQHTEEQA